MRMPVYRLGCTGICFYFCERDEDGVDSGVHLQWGAVSAGAVG